MDPLTNISTKSSRSFAKGRLILNLEEGSKQRIQIDDIPPFPSPTRINATTRSLRRKRNLSTYRVSAPAQSPVAEAFVIPPVQRPQSMISPLSLGHGLATLHSSTKPIVHNRSHSQPNVVRLGHPTRPYYSAIRSNMSRPSSPLGNTSANLSRPVSTVLPSHISSSSPNILDDTEDGDTFLPPATSRRPSSSKFSLGFGGFSSPASALHSGASVSGEMEMRMALAALARESHQQDTSFQFQETGKKHASVGWRVKQVGKSLKSLVRRKHTP
ncbi:hypothetical protein B0H15DRAFT_202563 [Mycena belliarum]|uniref:Uncharacterized protein n=1 Tax=Mycena belliarum TaxID=1033014 RepID=A0AAD6UJ93_9AGAR|nr:hypothetical protein B0H15DRAFT_202563 [Mycena belliae]